LLGRKLDARYFSFSQSVVPVEKIVYSDTDYDARSLGETRAGGSSMTMLAATSLEMSTVTETTPWCHVGSEAVVGTVLTFVAAIEDLLG
jgi:hypothetical protein